MSLRKVSWPDPTPSEWHNRRFADLLNLCGVLSYSGARGEPLACGWTRGHEGTHSWASLPTFTAPEQLRPPMPKRFR